MFVKSFLTWKLRATPQKMSGVSQFFPISRNASNLWNKWGKCQELPLDVVFKSTPHCPRHQQMWELNQSGSVSRRCWNVWEHGSNVAFSCQSLDGINVLARGNQGHFKEIITAANDRIQICGLEAWNKHTCMSTKMVAWSAMDTGTRLP
jgi:hypothetical protein